jgi:hypothetical protein
MSIPGMEELADRPRPVCRICGRVMGASICSDCRRKLKGKPPLTTEQRRKREMRYTILVLCIFFFPFIAIIIDAFIG